MNKARNLLNQINEAGAYNVPDRDGIKLCVCKDCQQEFEYPDYIPCAGIQCPKCGEPLEEPDTVTSA